MARYIDADALKKQMHNAVYDYWNFGTGGYYLAEDAIQDIDNAPTVDVVEVRHGRWRRRAKYGEVYCSECGTLERYTDGNFKSRYCPNCGAKMDGGNNEA